MPTPTIPAGNLFMNAPIYTGTGSYPRSITGLNFQPDFIWAKDRTTANNHALVDSVRGGDKLLISNLTNAEATVSGLVSSFNADGYTFNAASGSTNANLDLYVNWVWKAGGAAVTNTAGSISSQVSANTTSGFSVVTYTGTGSNATVGHGLGVAPQMVIVKCRTGTSSDHWSTWHIGLTSAAYVVYLDLTNAQSSGPTQWNSTAPTSTVFSIGTADTNRAAGYTYVAYCWAPIAGYSAFGSYTGNGSADGTFVYLGFRPRFIMIKKTSAAQDWYLYDTARDTYNAAPKTLFPNGSYAEESTRPIDILSNGFKLRISTAVNDSGATYIYACFAENPFKYANAR
jgi:hypothetical protein